MTRMLDAEGMYDRMLAAWRDNEWLRFAYPDAQTFAEHARAIGATTVAKSLAELLSTCSTYGLRAEVATARLAAFNSPMSARSSFPIAQRIGTRLILWLYGPIGVATERGAIDADWVCRTLTENADALSIFVRIDSSGGSIVAARQIATQLRSHRAKKIAVVDRTCWSAAYYIASSSTRIFARRDASFMFHPPSCAASGNARDLHDQGYALDDLDRKYRRWVRARRPNVSADQLDELWHSERFFSATEALEIGLVDRLTESLSSAQADEIKPRNRSNDEHSQK